MNSTGDTGWKLPSIPHSVLAGGGAGVASSIATVPLDVVKTRLQAQRASKGGVNYLGILDTVKGIKAQDGLRGFYRGLGPTILGYLPTWAIYFAIYEGIKQRFGERPLGNTIGSRPSRGLWPASTPKGYQPASREHPWAVHLLSAMSAGACSTICTNPLWVIKTRFMTQAANEGRYRHTYDAFITIYRSEGIRAFYRGLLPSLLGILHVAVQFPLYESLRAYAQSHAAGPHIPWSSILLCTGVAKITASVATYPHEVVRTRLQNQREYRPSFKHPSTSRVADTVNKPYKGLIDTAMRIITEEGWRGLYKGLSVNLLRTVPNSAVTMLAYETFMGYLNEGEGNSH